LFFRQRGAHDFSPFPAALEAAAKIRNELVPNAALVLITNGTGLLNDQTFALLRRAAAGLEPAGLEPTGSLALKVWLKLDAGTEDWYAKMDRSAVPFDRLIAAIKSFAAIAPFTIQTMLCAINGETPPAQEEAAWERLVLELAAPGHLTGVQIYGKARPSPTDSGGPGDRKASQVPAVVLEERVASLRAALPEPIPVEVFP
jgi:histidinol dehydrogenase